MMRDFAYFCRMNIPWTPPFVVLIALFMAISLALYYTTKSRGYLITCLTGFCYVIPWLLRFAVR
jgi:hypothetical protein